MDECLQIEVFANEDFCSGNKRKYLAQNKLGCYYIGLSQNIHWYIFLECKYKNGLKTKITVLGFTSVK